MLLNNRRNKPSEVSIIFGNLLENFIGVYTYDDGRTRPAINVGKPIKNAKVTGLELIVPKMPMVRDSMELWILYVIDRKDSSDALYDLFLVLKHHIILIDSVAYLPQNTELGAYDQVAIGISVDQINKLAFKMGLYDPGSNLYTQTCQTSIDCM